MKFDPNGNCFWLAPYSASTNSVDYGVAMALGPLNTLYLTGDSFGKQPGTNLLDPTNTFISTIKYIETNAPGRPQITTQPVGQTVDETLPASFTVQATGALSYQMVPQRRADYRRNQLRSPISQRQPRRLRRLLRIRSSNDSGTVLSPEVRLDVQPFIPTRQCPHQASENPKKSAAVIPTLASSGPDATWTMNSPCASSLSGTKATPPPSTILAATPATWELAANPTPFLVTSWAAAKASCYFHHAHRL